MRADARFVEPAAVEKVTQDLADYLRFTLSEARPLEPLARELQSLEKYLAVQQARFGQRRRCRVEFDPAADHDSNSVLSMPDCRMIDRNVPRFSSSCIGTGTVTVPASSVFCMAT